jgi:hypothetical protein
MTENESLGCDRRLIFENVANGVPIETIMATFLRSRLEVQKEVEFVARKITEYRFRPLRGRSCLAAPMRTSGFTASICSRP